MNKWEYLFVTCFYCRSSYEGKWASGDAWRPAYVNGQQLPDWQRGPSAWEFSDQLGEDGWELVNLMISHSTQVSGEESYRLVFKRPKSQ